jgi:LmbE family N-acetylglucosaminyl deacetylase
MNILVIAAHPDDEVLGMGATIKKLSTEGHNIHLCVVTEGATAQYTNAKMIQIRKKSCIEAGKILGIKDFYFLNFPDMKLDTVPHLELNKNLEKIIKKFKPTVVYTTPYNDLNKDHTCVFESTLVSTRPFSSTVKMILSYELPGIVKKQFNPNIFCNVSKEMKFKIKAFQKYKSEIQKFPHPRSVKAMETQAEFRGIQSGLKQAESFKLIRKIED